jgi:hypothetical protein
MMMPLLVFLLGLQGPTQPQFDRQQQQLDRVQQQLDRVQQQVQGIGTELDKTTDLLSRELKANCSAEVQWQPGPLKISNLIVPVKASLFSLVSAPMDACLPAEIRITATYFTDAGNFVCSGNLSVGQTNLAQNTYFEFRPYELELFAKWRDRPTLEQSTHHRLLCHDIEGLEVPYPAGQASSMRIFATVFPKRGGLSTVHIEIPLPRLPRP